MSTHPVSAEMQPHCDSPHVSVIRSELETLSRMERDDGFIERGGTGRGTYWTLSRALSKQLIPESKEQSRIDWEAAKTRVMSILKDRAKAGEPGLSNSELRQITSFDRNQVAHMMRELRNQHPEIQMSGVRKGSRYVYAKDLLES